MSKPKYFTYAKDAIAAAGPNHNVHFQTGLGYYLMPKNAIPVKPAPELISEHGAGQTFGVDPRTGLPRGPGNPYQVPRRPTPPKPPVSPYGPLTAAQIDQQAGLLAQAGLDPQEAEVRRQQALAQQQAVAQEQAIQGFQKASAEMLAGLAPQAGDAYTRAAQEEGALGQGLSGGVAKDVADRVAADQSFAESQGQTGGSTIDQEGLKNSVYALNGMIPGDTFAEQGAAAQTWAVAQAPIALNAGREELDARMAQARSENDQYAQQLIQLAAQYPGLKAQALQQMNQYEIDKANYRQSVLLNRQTIANQKADNARQDRALRDQEKAAGIDAKQAADASAYKWASLTFQTQKAQQAAQVAVEKAKAQGRQVDAAASKGVGYLVGKDGQPILGANGKRIPVQQSGDMNTAKTKIARAKAYDSATNAATELAVSLRGKPKASSTYGQIGGTKGRYVASDKFKAIPQGKPGAVFADGTTNDPKRAAYSGGATDYQDAYNRVYAQLPVASLRQYGYSDQQITSIVKTALRSAGFKRK